jgi:DNA-binding transcriptional MerR regulator
MVHGGNPLRSEDGGFATYECRTVYDTELADNQWKRAEQSMACRTRENQLLTKQRDEARERIKRLEQENDALRADLLLWDKAGIGFTTEDKP